MHLEKLDVLEERLNRLVENFTRLREEKGVLERSLQEQVGQMSDLQREVVTLRQERDVVRERLSRLVEIVDRLETLETARSGEDS